MNLHTSNVGASIVLSANLYPTDYKKIWRSRSDVDIFIVK